MNWDRIEGNWKQMSGKVRQQWGKLTDDDLDGFIAAVDRAVRRRQPSATSNSG